MAGTDWAVKDSTNTMIVAASTLSGFYTPNTATGLSGNADVTGPLQTTLAADTSISTLRFSDTGSLPHTISINSGSTLTAGAILMTPSARHGQASVIPGNVHLESASRSETRATASLMSRSRR